MVVITSKIGQLGNRLFLFAAFISFAAEYGVYVLNPAFDEYSNYFKAFRSQPIAGFPLHQSYFPHSTWFRHLVFILWHYLASIVIRLGWSNRYVGAIALEWDKRCELDDSDFRDLAARTGTLLIRGWEFRCEGLLEKHKSVVREIFTPVQPHKTNVEMFLHRTRAECDVLVGLHIRRGDYQSFQGGRFFYSIAEYRSLIERVRDLFVGRNVRFLVCSSETLDEREFHGLPICMAPGHELEDLYCLAGCDFIVGPPSTYSMWASFYGAVPLHQIRNPSQAISLEGFGMQR